MKAKEYKVEIAGLGLDKDVQKLLFAGLDKKKTAARARQECTSEALWDEDLSVVPRSEVKVVTKAMNLWIYFP